VSRVFTSTYHDTPDRRFAKAGIALRRRVENGLSLWEVELPAGSGATALSEPGGPADLPPMVADLLSALLRGRTLVEVTTVRTRRTEDGDHDDAHDDVAVLENNWVVDEFSSDAEDEDPGVHVVETKKSKTRPKLPRDASALAHLQGMLRTQYDEILAHDPGTRLGSDPEHVHKFRVAVRRLRTVLRATRPMLDERAVDDVRAELKWLSGELGAVRDLDVLIRDLSAESRAVAVKDAAPMAMILRTYDQQRDEARNELRTALSSDRYYALLSRLELYAEAPPWSGKRLSLPKLARREFGKLEKAVASLDRDASDDGLHRARVRAKRARYTAELTERATGKRASRFIARAKEFQDVVGEHQDAVVADERLRTLARDKPEVAFIAGRLAERQRLRRQAAREQTPRAWKKLGRAGRKAWR
jgi:CHAD domain-containing protein